MIQKDNSNITNIHNDIREFIELLENEDEIIRIKKNVNSTFELPAIVSKLDGNKAVIFENVENKTIPVISNLIGTRKRFAMAMGSKEKNDIHKIINNSINNRNIKVKTINNISPYYQNSSNNLSILPIVTHFEKDAGPYITSSIVYAKDQENGNQNSSTHRLLKLDDKNMAIRMVEGRHLHKCFMYSKDHREDLKVAIVIGVHPAINIAAAYQASYGIDEMHIANTILNGNLLLDINKYSQLLIPAMSEIVLEGKILYDKTQEEWMVEMLKTYDFRRQQPVFELEKIRFRDGAIFHDILPGYSEHRLLMGLPVESKMLDQVKNVVPSTSQVFLTDGGSNWLTAVIQIKKRVEGESKNALLAALAAHPSLKIAIVVDEDIDPTNSVEVEYAISTRCQADKDMIIIKNAKGSSLDPSSDQINLLTTKLGIDATATLLKVKERFEIAKIPGEENIKLSEYLSE
ncbi:MAG TPA: UbiD family decarboxylase [Nitrososphaeraceae archaeon]|nr:UbiD family decarboxylase [Nitrososphaeraceae archaeon]